MIWQTLANQNHYNLDDLESLVSNGDWDAFLGEVLSLAVSTVPFIDRETDFTFGRAFHCFNAKLLCCSPSCFTSVAVTLCHIYLFIFFAFPLSLWFYRLFQFSYWVLAQLNDETETFVSPFI